MSDESTDRTHRLKSLVRDFRQMSEDYKGSDEGLEPTDYQRGGMDALAYAADELEELIE